MSRVRPAMHEKECCRCGCKILKGEISRQVYAGYLCYKCAGLEYSRKDTAYIEEEVDDYIKKHPGSKMCDIIRNLHISQGTLLTAMVNLIIVEDDDNKLYHLSYFYGGENETEKRQPVYG